jgi:hypothetical protein
MSRMLWPAQKTKNCYIEKNDGSCGKIGRKTLKNPN